MSKLLKLLTAISLITVMPCVSFSQSLSINTDGSTAHTSALLDVKSTSKGVLVPRMSRTQRNAIASPATGLMIFQDSPDSVGFYYYNGSAWTWVLANSNADSLAWRTGGNSGTSVATHYMGTSDNTPLVIKTNNTPVMHFSTNRAIGIGTTVPGTGPGIWAKLDIRDEDGLASDVSLTVAGSGYPVYNLIKQRGTLAAPTTVLANELLGEMNGQMYNGAGYYKAAAIQIIADGTVSGDAPGRIRFYTTPTASLVPLERMSIRANGNVSIGVTTPTAILDVNGNNTGSSSLQLRSGNNGASFLSNQILLGWSGTDSYRHAIKTRHHSGLQSDNSIDFYVWSQGVDAVATVGTKRVMTIDGLHKGMVGIGTATPRSELHITDGSASLKTVTDAGNYGASLLITDNNIPRIYFEAAGEAANKKLMGITMQSQNLSIGSLNDAGSAFDQQNILVANRDGRVGVGMVPVNTFDVTGSVKFLGDFLNQELTGAHGSAVQNVPFTNGLFNPLTGTTTSITIADGNGVNNSAVLITGHARVFGGTLNGGSSSMGGYFLLLERDVTPAFSAPIVLTYTSDICYIKTPNGAATAAIGFGGGGHISYVDAALVAGTTYYYRLSLYPNGVSITSGTYDVYQRDLAVIQIKR